MCDPIFDTTSFYHSNGSLKKTTACLPFVMSQYTLCRVSKSAINYKASLKPSVNLFLLWILTGLGVGLLSVISLSQHSFLDETICLLIAIAYFH